MSNQALPKVSSDLLAQHQNSCQNLGLILDKYAPWGQDNRGNWDLSAKVKPPNKKRDARKVTGGEAKGHWLKTGSEIYADESTSIFIGSDNQFIVRVDTKLMQAKQKRWEKLVKRNAGIAFHISLSERMAAGLGASHVLETGLTLDRNTGLPYLPGSSVKGLARAWGLIEVASQFGIRLSDNGEQPLNKLAEILISSEKSKLDDVINELLNSLSDKENISEDAGTYLDYFRLIFGSQHNAGAVSFLDGIYYGNEEPRYSADVMTPHYVQYYTNNGGKPPSEDDNPNPVSFLTVDQGNQFAFGMLPRQAAFQNISIDTNDILGVAQDWLVKALSQLGAGSKAAAGYGFFNRKSAKPVKV